MTQTWTRYWPPSSKRSRFAPSRAFASALSSGATSATTTASRRSGACRRKSAAARGGSRLRCCLRLPLPRHEGFVDEVQDLFEAKRLRDDEVDAVAAGLLGVERRAPTGDEADGEVRTDLLDLARDLVAVHAGQAEVGED